MMNTHNNIYREKVLKRFKDIIELARDNGAVTMLDIQNNGIMDRITARLYLTLLALYNVLTLRRYGKTKVFLLVKDWENKFEVMVNDFDQKEIWEVIA